MKLTCRLEGSHSHVLQQATATLEQKMNAMEEEDISSAFFVTVLDPSESQDEEFATEAFPFPPFAEDAPKEESVELLSMYIQDNADKDGQPSSILLPDSQDEGIVHPVPASWNSFLKKTGQTVSSRGSSNESTKSVQGSAVETVHAGPDLLADQHHEQQPLLALCSDSEDEYSPHSPREIYKHDSLDVSFTGSGDAEVDVVQQVDTSDVPDEDALEGAAIIVDAETLQAKLDELDYLIPRLQEERLTVLSQLEFLQEGTAANLVESGARDGVATGVSESIASRELDEVRDESIESPSSDSDDPDRCKVTDDTVRDSLDVDSLAKLLTYRFTNMVHSPATETGDEEGDLDSEDEFHDAVQDLSDLEGIERLEDQVSAAVIMQSTWRGYSVRSNGWQRLDMAVKLQAMARMWQEGGGNGRVHRSAYINNLPTPPPSRNEDEGDANHEGEAAANYLERIASMNDAIYDELEQRGDDVICPFAGVPWQSSQPDELDAQATRLQSAWRRMSTRRAYLEFLASTTWLQAMFRSKAARREYQAKTDAASLIQRHFRAHVSIGASNRDQDQAAMTIQRFARGLLAQMRTDDEAATTIQSQARGYVTRRDRNTSEFSGEAQSKAAKPACPQKRARLADATPEPYLSQPMHKRVREKKEKRGGYRSLWRWRLTKRLTGKGANDNDGSTTSAGGAHLAKGPQTAAKPQIDQHARRPSLTTIEEQDAASTAGSSSPARSLSLVNEPNDGIDDSNTQDFAMKPFQAPFDEDGGSAQFTPSANSNAEFALKDLDVDPTLEMVPGELEQIVFANRAAMENEHQDDAHDVADALNMAN
ncbi:hypothetical protein MPSEU_000022600 [Mayamaea pseudoterrestris]|nr:hypothetical protein MPSEU_000022600 [Mayamaea pseudoterrestris]